MIHYDTVVMNIMRLGVEAIEPIVSLFWRGWEIFGDVGLAFWHFPWHYPIDIGIMTFIVYQAYVRLQGTRAIRILSGIVILGLGYLIAQAGGLFLTSWLLGGVWTAALLFVIVIFQTEIRQMLEQVNPKLPTKTLLHWARQARLPEESLVIITETAFAFASRRCGALWVFERHDFLEPLLNSSGIVIDAWISPELLETIFTPPTPLHDGALYIRRGRAYRAGCVLPLSDNRWLASFYGTRHRAALGISEQSDALVVIISEERGKVSVIEDGKITVVDTPAELLNWLTDRLRMRGEKPKQKRSIRALATRNWRPKVVALAAVSLLWFVLVGQQNTEVGFSVPVVYYNVPKTLTIDSDRVREVYVRVRGSREMINFLDAGRLQVAIDLKEANTGWQRYPVSDKEINIPLGLQLAGVNPPEIKLRLRKKPFENSGQ